jgi:hypothetical protein
MSEQEVGYTSTALQQAQDHLKAMTVRLAQGREALATAEAIVTDRSTQHRALVAARLAGTPDSAEAEARRQLTEAIAERDATLAAVLAFEADMKQAEEAVAEAHARWQQASDFAAYNDLVEARLRQRDRKSKALRELRAADDKDAELCRQQQALVPRLRRWIPALRFVRHPSALATQGQKAWRRIVTAVLGPTTMVEVQWSDHDPTLARELAEQPMDAVITRQVLGYQQLEWPAPAPSPEQVAS